MKRLLEPILLLIAATIMLALVLWDGTSGFPGLQLVLCLAAGWWFFLERVLPEVRVEPVGVATALVALVLLAVGLHWLGRSLRNTRWPLRWTVSAIAGVIVLFGSGVSVVGLFRSLVWLAQTPGPYWEDGRLIR